MAKDDWVYVGHIHDQAERALSLVLGKDKNQFDSDLTLRLSLTHLLQIVGEAARRISEEFKIEHPDVPWKEMIGMRHKVVHDYMDVDEEIVWLTVNQRLPDLVRDLKALEESRESFE